jgi:hypothetical protein
MGTERKKSNTSESPQQPEQRASSNLKDGGMETKPAWRSSLSPRTTAQHRRSLMREEERRRARRGRKEMQ